MNTNSVQCPAKGFAAAQAAGLPMIPRTPVIGAAESRPAVTNGGDRAERRPPLARAERLKIARSRYFRSGRAAAAALGVAPATYTAHENSFREYGIDDAIRYAECFGVSLQWLLTEKAPVPTVKCSLCKVDVPVDKLDLPNRCLHPYCPLKRTT